MKYMNNKSLNKICFLLGIVAAVTFNRFIEQPHNVAVANKVRCNSFPSQADAQITYDSNRSMFKRLDRDRDGVACEELLKAYGK